jgi:hypothetical protein
MSIVGVLYGFGHVSPRKAGRHVTKHMKITTHCLTCTAPRVLKGVFDPPRVVQDEKRAVKRAEIQRRVDEAKLKQAAEVRPFSNVPDPSRTFQTVLVALLERSSLSSRTLQNVPDCSRGPSRIFQPGMEQLFDFDDARL